MCGDADPGELHRRLLERAGIGRHSPQAYEDGKATHRNRHKGVSRGPDFRSLDVGRDPVGPAEIGAEGLCRVVGLQLSFDFERMTA